MRNYQNIDSYLNKLTMDIYPQPPDEGHSGLAYKVISHWMSRLPSCKTVLDAGCGTGFCQDFFEKHGVYYEGVCLGEDFIAATSDERRVQAMDFSFLDYPDETFDLVFSRHSLEHSPMPLLTLMEWRRVSKQWLGLVLPTPDWYSYAGRNHYYVLQNEQWVNLLNCAGWSVIWNEVDNLPKDAKYPDKTTPHEYWIFAEKKR